MTIADRKQRERKARMRLILNAGVRVFARHGYHRASMDLIAEEAELGKATIYYYYKNKDDLLLGILTEGVKDFFHQLEQRLQPNIDPIEKLKIIIHESVMFFERYPDYFKLYMYLNAHPVFRKKIFRAMHPLLTQKIKIIKAIFLEAQKQGRIKAIPAEYLQSIFGSLVMGMGAFSTRKLSHEQLEEQARYLAQVFFEGILANDREKQMNER